MPEKTRRDFETLSLAHPVAQLIGLLQILVAECQIAQIPVRSPELGVSQSEFTVAFNGPFERRDRLGVLPLPPQLNSDGIIPESLERGGCRLFNRRIELADRGEGFAQFLAQRGRGRSFLFFQAEDGIRYATVTGVQTCALPISTASRSPPVGRSEHTATRRRRSSSPRRTGCSASTAGSSRAGSGHTGPRRL